jgi:hypothetical protein
LLRRAVPARVRLAASHERSLFGVQQGKSGSASNLERCSRRRYGSTQLVSIRSSLRAASCSILRLNCDLRLTRRAVLQHAAPCMGAESEVRRCMVRPRGQMQTHGREDRRRKPREMQAANSAVAAGPTSQAVAEESRVRVRRRSSQRRQIMPLRDVTLAPSESERRRWEPPEHGRDDELPAAHASHERRSRGPCAGAASARRRSASPSVRPAAGHQRRHRRQTIGTRLPGAVDRPQPAQVLLRCIRSCAETGRRSQRARQGAVLVVSPGATKQRRSASSGTAPRELLRMRERLARRRALRAHPCARVAPPPASAALEPPSPPGSAAHSQHAHPCSGLQQQRVRSRSTRSAHRQASCR